VARTRYDEPDEPGESDESDEPDWGADDSDVDRDYDPDDPETYPEGVYVDNEPAVIPCPHCRAEIDEESQQCPRCGMYLSKEDEPPRAGKSSVWLVLMVLALLAAVLWVAGR
jgi:predicted nucleic acid-binding Zn ribbon protein